MEPRKVEPEKAPEATKEEPKLKRFRIVKLEERIAPAAGWGTDDQPTSSTNDSWLC